MLNMAGTSRYRTASSGGGNTLPTGSSNRAKWWIPYSSAPIARVTYQTGVQTDGSVKVFWVGSMPDSRAGSSPQETGVPLQAQTAWQSYIQDVSAGTTVIDSGINSGTDEVWTANSFTPVAGKTYKGWARVRSADGQWSTYAGTRFVAPTGNILYFEDYGAVGDGIHQDGTDYGNSVYTGPIRLALAAAQPGDVVTSRRKGTIINGVISSGINLMLSGGFTNSMIGKKVIVYGGGAKDSAAVTAFRTTVSAVASDGNSATLTTGVLTNQASATLLVDYPEYWTGHLDVDGGLGVAGGFTFDGTGCVFTSKDPAHAGFRTTLPDVTYIGVHYRHDNTVKRGNGLNNNDGTFFTESSSAVGGRKINCYAERCPDAGFLYYNQVSDQHIVDCTVDHSMADPFHVTGSSHDISFIRNTAYYVGDDASANIGYRSDGDSARPYNITFENPRMYGQDWGRGLSYGGCYNCLATDVVQDGGAMAAFLIGSDGDQANSTHVQVRGFTITNPNARRGQKPTYSQGSSTNSTISDDPWLKLLNSSSTTQQSDILLENGTVTDGRYIQIISYGSGPFKDASIILRGITMNGSVNAGTNWLDDGTYPHHIVMTGVSVPNGSTPITNVSNAGTNGGG